MVDNTEVRILIEEVIEKHCDGTFLNGLKSATFVGEPQVCADEIIAIVFGILEDEEAALRARAEKVEAALRERAEAAEKALLMSEAAFKKWQSATCHWSCPEEEDDAYWETDCGLVWEFQEGDPRENDVRFCPKCGRHLVVDEPPAHDAGKE